MKRIFATIMSFVMSLSFLGSPVMATNQLAVFGDPLGSDKVSILKDCANEDGEESIKCVLRLVVDIMSVLIGILGVIGITITGIQYLTAGGSEEKTRKAKRRMLEIVIGLAAYAVLYALLTWLLPGFDPSNI